MKVTLLRKRALDEIEEPNTETDYATLVFTGSEVVSGVGEGVVEEPGIIHYSVALRMPLPSNLSKLVLM